MDKLIRELKEENDRLKKMMEGGDLSALLAAAPASGGDGGGGGGGAVMTEEGKFYLKAFFYLFIFHWRELKEHGFFFVKFLNFEAS